MNNSTATKTTITKTSKAPIGYPLLGGKYIGYLFSMPGAEHDYVALCTRESLGHSDPRECIEISDRMIDLDDFRREPLFRLNDSFTANEYDTFRKLGPSKEEKLGKVFQTETRILMFLSDQNPKENPDEYAEIQHPSEQLLYPNQQCA